METSMICQECGLHYVLPVDKKLHERRHKRVQKARDFFGAEFILFGPEQERLKAVAWIICNVETNSLSKRVEASGQILKAWFARSLNASDFSLKHPRFNDFVASLLEDSYHGLFPEDVFHVLRKKFCPAPKGIKVTGSYWVPQNSKRIGYTETRTLAEEAARPVDKSCQGCRRECKQFTKVIGCPRYEPVNPPTKRGKAKQGIL